MDIRDYVSEAQIFLGFILFLVGTFLYFWFFRRGELPPYLANPPPTIETEPTWADWGWRAFQIAMIVGFGFANIYFEWGTDGLTAGVLGGLIAWGITRVGVAISEARRAARLRRRQLDDGRAEVEVIPPDFRGTSDPGQRASRDRLR